VVFHLPQKALKALMPTERSEQLQRPDASNLLHGDLTERILGAFFQVHHELGYGFVEAVYSAAMAIMLLEMGLRVEREVPIAVYFHGIMVGSFRADMIVESKVILEFKALPELIPKSEAQLLNYLRSTELEIDRARGRTPPELWEKGHVQTVAGDQRPEASQGSVNSVPSAPSAASTRPLDCHRGMGY
jgi:GxxExxY protein